MMKPMMKKFAGVLALATSLGVSIWLTAGTSGPRADKLNSVQLTSASQRLPEGLVLPASDLNLHLASLVTTDLDVDGDLDVVAADTTGGSLRIVVWVNDGDGRLTRKAPIAPRNSGFAPSAPSFSDHESSSYVTIQSDSYAVDGIAVSSWFSLSSKAYRFARSAAPASTVRCTLRSRAPPASLRLA